MYCTYLDLFVSTGLSSSTPLHLSFSHALTSIFFFSLVLLMEIKQVYPA